MSDETPTAPAEALPDVVLFAPEEFRVQLLLQLPALVLKVETSSSPAGVPSDEFPGLDLYDRVEHDREYSSDKLGAWILEQFELAQLQAGTEAEYATAEVVEMAGAAGVINSSIEFARYVAALAEVLKRGLGLNEQWDLARTMQAESDRLNGVVGQLLARYPQLLTPVAPELQGVDGQPLSAD